MALELGIRAQRIEWVPPTVIVYNSVILTALYVCIIYIYVMILFQLSQTGGGGAQGIDLFSIRVKDPLGGSGELMPVSLQIKQT